MTTAPLAEATGLALLHLIWQGAIIAGILAAGLALMRQASANTRYLASCAALALILVAGIVTGVRLYTPADAPITMSAEPEAAPPPPILAASWKPTNATPLSITVPRPTISSTFAFVRRYTPYIVLVWLAGVIVFTLRLLVSWKRTTALVDERSSTTAQLQHLVDSLAARLGIDRAVRLIETAAVEVPSVIGWLRPVILLPISSITGLTAEQLEMVLAHELAHIRRHDFLANALQSVAETLLFYHPAVWWISRQIRIERENCCDDLAVATCGDALQYARALAQLEQLRAVPMPAVAANGGSLLSRVRRLVAGRPSDRDARGWPAAIAVVTFALVFAIVAIPLLARTPKPRRAKSNVEVTAKKHVAPAVEAEPDPDPDPDPAPEPDDQEVVAAASSAKPVTHVAVAVAPVIAGSLEQAIEQGIEDGVEQGVEGALDPDDDQSSDTNTSGKLTVDELVALRIHNVTPEYIDAMRSTFGPSLSIRAITNMRVQDITPQYVESMRALFGKDITSKDVVSLKVMGVTAEYLRDMQSAGVSVKSAHDASSLRAMGVTPAFVKSLADAGYTNLTARELVRLASSGVDADFIRSMAKYKTKQ